MVRPRLSDAKFFFEQDKKKSFGRSLAAIGAMWCITINSVAKQNAAQRVKKFSLWLARLRACNAVPMWCWLNVRALIIESRLVITDMVGEFPELQGIMGSYYAQARWRTRRSCGGLLRNIINRVLPVMLYQKRATGTMPLRLADKLETSGRYLEHRFATDWRSKIRLLCVVMRLGILRMLVEKALPISLHDP